MPGFSTTQLAQSKMAGSERYSAFAMGDIESATQAGQGISMSKRCAVNNEARDHLAAVSAQHSLSTSWVSSLSSFKEEVKTVACLAGPMMTVHFSQYMLQVVAVMMAGHLGVLALSSTAIAVTLSGALAFCIFLGMAGALETLCGQAYGAEQFHVLGTQTRTAIICLNLCCLPLSALWLNIEKLLLVIGQDSSISHETGKLMKLLIPSFFASATLQPLIRFFQMQSLVGPLLLSSVGTLLLHIPICWILVFKSGLEHLGAGLAMSISYWVNVLFFVLYIKFYPLCKKNWWPESAAMFRGITEFFRFAVPSASMVCLEWWSYELIVLISGLLPNPKLETSVLSVCLSTVGALYAMPYGLGAAGSTRVSNKLGAGNAGAARIAVYATMFLSVAETIITNTSLFAGRHAFAYVFTNDEEVEDYFTSMTPLVCLSVLLDSLQGSLSGIARGCGWQNLGAYVNLGAFYLCGIPIAVILGFKAKMRGIGLWIGIISGAFVQTLLLAIITGCINWKTQASKARDRIFGSCPTPTDSPPSVVALTL